MGAKSKRIVAEEANCVGCLTCTLHCSLTKLGLFNPMKAYIKVSVPLDKPNLISFTEDCDDCGVCAEFCPYNALSIEKNNKADENT